MKPPWGIDEFFLGPRDYAEMELNTGEITMMNSVVDKSDRQTADGPDERKSSFALAKIWGKDDGFVILKDSITPENSIYTKFPNSLEVRN